MRERLATAPSFVALEGYDALLVLAAALRSGENDRTRTAGSWADIAVEGTRGHLRLSRVPGLNVWQWAWPPVQVVDRDPNALEHFRILHAG